MFDIVRVLSRVANLAFDYGCSNPCSFRDMTFFWIFSNFFRKLRYKNLNKFEITISVVRLCQGISGVASFSFQYDRSNSCSFRDITFFMTFSEIFKKNLNVKKFQNFEDINAVSGISEGTLRELQILPLNRTAQNLAVYGYDVFCDFFKRIFMKIKLIFFKDWNS